MKRWQKICVVIFLLVFLLPGTLILWLNRETGNRDVEWRNFLTTNNAEKFMDMGDYRLRYIEFGKGDTVLMIHGFADSSYAWHRNIKEISKAGFHVIAIDFPGMGKSGAPKNFSFKIDDLANEVLKFTRKKNIKKFHLIGNSMGGGIALYLSLFSPKQVNRVILSNPVGYPELGAVLRPMIKNKALRSFVKKTSGIWSVRIALFNVYHRWSRIKDEVVAEYSQPLQRPDYRDNCTKLINGFFSKSFEEMEQSYGNMEQPCLILWGSHDNWIPLDPFGNKLHQNLKNSELTIISDAGHVPFQERPEIFNKYTIDFLKKKQ